MKKRIINILVMLIGIFMVLPSVLGAEEQIEARIGDREYTSMVILLNY